MLKDQKKPNKKTVMLPDPMTRRPPEDVRMQKPTGKGMKAIKNLGAWAHPPKTKK